MHVWMVLYSPSGFWCWFFCCLCAPVQGQHLAPCPGCPCMCWGEILLGASTNMMQGRAALFAHADPHPVSAILEQLCSSPILTSWLWVSFS